MRSDYEVWREGEVRGCHERKDCKEKVGARDADCLGNTIAKLGSLKYFVIHVEVHSYDVMFGRGGRPAEEPRY